jgi:2-oxoglutarate ferredoxin oxidoreductase subunit beta
MKRTSAEYKSSIKPVWCAGCSEYSVLSSVQKVLAELDIPPEDIVVVSGIGCSGRFSHYLNAYSLHGTHGRALPISLGVKAARPDLTVLTVGGDGDGLGIGGGHISHAARKNVDLTYLMIDNRIYGLTKGQASPTTPLGAKTKTSPYGVYEDALAAIPIFLAYDVSFIARGNIGDVSEISELVTAAITHKGMSIVYIVSPCRTFPVEGFKETVESSEVVPADHDRTDRLKAMELAYSYSPLYTGIFYQIRKPTLGDRLRDDTDRAQAEAGGKEVTIEQILQSFA